MGVERYWAQRSRVAWLKKGDRNTRFFHVRAMHRNKKNWIKGINNAEGIRVEDFKEICDVAKGYFHSVFMSKTSGDL